MLAEFDGDPAAIKALTNTARSDPGRFEHVAQRLRDNRATDAARAAVTAELAAAGVRVVDEPAYGERTVARLDQLRADGPGHGDTDSDADGETSEDAGEVGEMTVQAHAGCPGHAAYLRDRGAWSGTPDISAVYVCTDWRGHGHRERFETTPLLGSARSGRMSEQAKLERREVIANNKAWDAARPVRQRWLTAFLARRSAPKDAPAWTAATLASCAHDVRRAMEDGHQTALGLLGLAGDPPWQPYAGTPNPVVTAAATATPARATMLTLVCFSAASRARSPGTRGGTPPPPSRRTSSLCRPGATRCPTSNSSSSPPRRTPPPRTIPSPCRRSKSRPVTSPPAIRPPTPDHHLRSSRPAGPPAGRPRVRLSRPWRSHHVPPRHDRPPPPQRAGRCPVSAWVVTRVHIDVLVLASVQFAVPFDDTDPARRVLPGPEALAAAGAELWAENHRSVDHRYDEHSEAPAYPPPTAEVLLDPVAVVKAIDCYVYQSCEHPGWNGSRADRFCQRLRAAVMTGLPVVAVGGDPDRPYPAGWDAAPWGIDDLSQAAVGAATSAGGVR